MTLLLFVCALMAGEIPGAPAESPAPAPGNTAPATPGPVMEKDLLGTYLQIRTGGILAFLPGGKLQGWPAGGTWKLTGPNHLEILSKKQDAEERLSVQVISRDGGLILTRGEGERSETILLDRLHPAKIDPVAWQGPCMMHILLAGDKTATKRRLTMDAEGHLRNREGGYYLRVLQDSQGRKLAHASNLEDQTKSVQVLEVANILVVFDSLEKPALLSIIQLHVEE
ncbi:MAG: hypothetical protein KA004_10355 [Verrucomicrobiales bacterium]|nr:hypothetical protein [Verrucomicrobiales bacterium]